MEYKAERIGNVIKVKPIIERKANGDVIVHVPSLPLIKKLTKQYDKEIISD